MCTFYWRVWAWACMFTQWYVAKVHTYTHTYTHSAKEVNSADFPCQLLGRHWFKETSICDVSTYLMNPLRSMEALVRYTACLRCFYVSDSFGIHAGPGHNVTRCMCSCVHAAVQALEKGCWCVHLFSVYLCIYRRECVNSELCQRLVWAFVNTLPQPRRPI